MIKNIIKQWLKDHDPEHLGETQVIEELTQKIKNEIVYEIQQLDAPPNLLLNEIVNKFVKYE